MYQRYTTPQEKGGPFVWISTHMVQRRMKSLIDQNNLSI